MTRIDIVRAPRPYTRELEFRGQKSGFIIDNKIGVKIEQGVNEFTGGRMVTLYVASPSGIPVKAERSLKDNDGIVHMVKPDSIFVLLDFRISSSDKRRNVYIGPEYMLTYKDGRPLKGQIRHVFELSSSNPVLLTPVSYRQELLEVLSNSRRAS